MEFDLYVGVDWSGAENPEQSIRIAFAEPREGRLFVSSVEHPRATGDSARRQALERVAEAVRDRVCLVGLDFPFGLPLQSWETLGIKARDWMEFARHELFADLDALEQRIDAWLSKDPIREGLRHYRRTDLAARNLGFPAKSPFFVDGAGQVRRMALTGIPLLRHFAERGLPPIWPMEKTSLDGSTTVEIYPRIVKDILSRRAFDKTLKFSTPQRRGDAMKYLEHHLRVTFDRQAQGRALESDDAFDAAMGVVGLYLAESGVLGEETPGLADLARHFAHDDFVVQSEGWIYGVAP